jgi:hypothetical protein
LEELPPAQMLARLNRRLTGHTEVDSSRACAALLARTAGSPSATPAISRPIATAKKCHAPRACPWAW